MIKLYDFELSGNCHKIRMMLSFLGLDYEKIDTDLRRKDHMSPDFIALNRLHKVPVLVDGEIVLRDSAAIMIYLARRYGKSEWYPDSPREMGEIQQWLSFSVNEVFNGLAMARAILIFNRDFDLKLAHTITDIVLDQLEFHLKDHDWLALDRFTLADIACYPYTALVHEGNISLEAFPAIRAWFKRIESLPRFVAMHGLPYPE
ncbi:glutathione S-transferase [Gammaproteobacteria bacterium]|nr:glutathione S-transferase [Gammaproteobacteria bacterium]